MSARATFVGYVEYAKTYYHAEFVVVGDSFLPDGAQVNWDTLKRRKIPVPEFPTYWDWVKERFERKRSNRAFLDQI